MEWYQELYTGESIQGKTEIIKWKVIHNAGQLQIYVIALASNPKNLFDIIPAWELMQKHYPKQKLMIIGLAWGWNEAVDVVKQIVTEVYENTGGFDIRNYLSSKSTESRGKT